MTVYINRVVAESLVRLLGEVPAGFEVIGDEIRGASPDVVFFDEMEELLKGQRGLPVDLPAPCCPPGPPDHTFKGKRIAQWKLERKGR